MSDVATAMRTLNGYAQELDQLSRDLADLERQLEPVDAQVTEFCDSYELGLYTQSVEQDGFRLPSAELRHKMAVRALPPELYGRHTALVASRERMQKRISTLKTLVEAQRSILSAHKMEAEAVRGPQPQWSRSAA